MVTNNCVYIDNKYLMRVRNTSLKVKMILQN